MGLGAVSYGGSSNAFLSDNLKSTRGNYLLATPTSEEMSCDSCVNFVAPVPGLVAMYPCLLMAKAVHSTPGTSPCVAEIFVAFTVISPFSPSGDTYYSFIGAVGGGPFLCFYIGYDGLCGLRLLGVGVLLVVSRTVPSFGVGR